MNGLSGTYGALDSFMHATEESLEARILDISALEHALAEAALSFPTIGCNAAGNKNNSAPTAGEPITRVSSYGARVFSLLAPSASGKELPPWAAEKGPTRAARWPVVLCGVVACIMSTGAFLRSPLAQQPAVRPFAVAVEDCLTRAHVALEAGTARVSATAREALDRLPR